MTVTHLHEVVTIPASLLVELIWAAEELVITETGIVREIDAITVTKAIEALAEQAPRSAALKARLDAARDAEE